MIWVVKNDSETIQKPKGLVWDFWNLKDHFGKNEKLKGPLDAFAIYMQIKFLYVEIHQTYTKIGSFNCC